MHLYLKVHFVYFISLFFFLNFLFLQHADAHAGHHPGRQGTKNSYPSKTAAVEKDRLQVINAAYIRDVKPIFQKKCADCHSERTVYPWYHKIPGIKLLIDSDIAEAREHLDISSDFPFKGHGTILEDFKAIRDEIEEGDMPPWRYWILHPGTRITDQDRKVIFQWIDESQKLFKE